MAKDTTDTILTVGGIGLAVYIGYQLFVAGKGGYVPGQGTGCPVVPNQQLATLAVQWRQSSVQNNTDPNEWGRFRAFASQPQIRAGDLGPNPWCGWPDAFGGPAYFDPTTGKVVQSGNPGGHGTQFF